MASPMAFDEIKTLPKSKSLLGHVGASGLNALGGFMAGRVRGQIATAFPDWKGAGTIGVFCFAVGLRMWAQSEKGWDRAIKEIAAGMAGFVGNDLYLILRAALGWGKWKREKPYAADSVVIHEKKYYRASKDIPGTPIAEPGKDSRWVLFETAQGYDPDQVAWVAQALDSNDALIEGMVKEQLLVAGPEIAAMSGKDFTQAEADQLYLGMRDSLKSVIKRLATE